MIEVHRREKVLLDKIKNTPKAVKASIVIFLASFISQGISFFTTPVFTRLMSIEEYGIIAQYNSWLSIITVFSTLSLSAGVFQVAMSEFEKDRDRFVFSTMVLSNVATLCIYAVIFIFINKFTVIFELPISLIVLMFLYDMFYPAMLMWLARERYEYNYVKVAVISIGAALVSQIISVVCVVLAKDTNLGIVKAWSSAIPLCIFSIALYIAMAKKSKFRVSGEYIKYALLFNLPLLIHYLAQYVLRSTDKIMITHYLGEGATGIYSLTTTIASISTLAWAAMNSSLTPTIYDNLKFKNYNVINKAVLAVTALFGLCCFCVALVGPEVVYILGSSKYSSGIYLIPPIAASCLLQAVYSNYSSIAFYYHKRLSTCIMTIIAAVLNIGFNYLLIPKFGFLGAAYATEIAYFVYTFLHFMNYKRIVGKEAVYNNKSIWGITIAISVLCLATVFLYPFPIVRWGTILVFGAIAIIQRKKILKLVLKKK